MTKLNNARQLGIYQAKTKDGKFRLIDFVDTIDDIMQKKKGPEYNKKVIINVNSAQDGGKHSEKQASFHMEISVLLLLINDIVNGTFKTTDYGAKSGAGAYIAFAGGKIARVFQLVYEAEKKSYKFQIGLFHPTATSGNGNATFPDFKRGPIDTHSIQIPEFQARAMMLEVKAGVEARLSAMATPVLTAPVQAVPKETNAPAPKQDEPKESVDEAFDDFNNLLDNMFEGM